MMNLRRFTASDQSQWDDFVAGSRNGTFLFLRGYMDYHADRFTDHSLLFFDEKQHLVALLPANEADNELYSHQGLTYGGFILGVKSNAVIVMQLFDTLLNYARTRGFRKIHYKPVPTIYQMYPTEEELYALWRYGAQQECCLISTTVSLKGTMQIEVERRRRRGMNKAEEQGMIIQSEGSLDVFWPIMEQNLLETYGAAPVHTLAEMQLLQSRFPRQIRCLLVRNHRNEAVAGAVLYEANSRAVHVQYGHATPEGKNSGALDLLYLSLIDYYRQRTRVEYFDFGTSNEQRGKYLNENLIAQKAGFGGRGVAYQCYCIDLCKQ